MSVFLWRDWVSVSESLKIEELSRTWWMPARESSREGKTKGIQPFGEGRKSKRWRERKEKRSGWWGREKGGECTLRACKDQTLVKQTVEFFWISLGRSRSNWCTVQLYLINKKDKSQLDLEGSNCVPKGEEKQEKRSTLSPLRFFPALPYSTSLLFFLLFLPPLSSLFTSSTLTRTTSVRW